MKYYLIAGEASGDLHGSNLMHEIKAIDPNASFRYIGGDKMMAEGGTLVRHCREMAFMGIVNVLKNIGTLKKSLRYCQIDLLEYNPDVLILIDYPGFNLRMAKFARKNNIRVFYYISPKVWAWKEYRVKEIKKYVNELFTILPFETSYFKRFGINVHYVGNPLLDAVDNYQKNAVSKDVFLKKNNLDQRPVIALLAGSRRQEIENTLPVMKKAAACYPEFQFVLAGVSYVDPKIYSSVSEGIEIPVIYNQTYQLLNHAQSALVASGTATLETALFEVPQTVLYKVEGGWIIQFFMKQFFLKIKWVSLPNLILNKEAIKEFIQMDMTFRNIKDELHRLSYDPEYRAKMINDYKQLKTRMGAPGSSARAAKKMVELLNKG